MQGSVILAPHLAQVMLKALGHQGQSTEKVTRRTHHYRLRYQDDFEFVQDSRRSLATNLHEFQKLTMPT